MEREELLHGPNLQSQCSSAIATLQSDNDALMGLKTTLANFNAGGQLKGAGIQGLEQQLNDYTTIIDAELMANESDIADYQTVIAAAGDEEINGTQVLDTWDRAKVGKQEAEDAAANARAWAGFFRLIMQQDTAFILEEDARVYDSQGEIWQSIIDWCQEKADQFDAAKAATDNLFTGSLSLRAVTASGLQDITTAFQGNGYTPNMGAAWRTELLELQTYEIEVDGDDPLVKWLDENGIKQAITLGSKGASKEAAITMLKDGVYFSLRKDKGTYIISIKGNAMQGSSRQTWAQIQKYLNENIKNVNWNKYDVKTLSKKGLKVGSAKADFYFGNINRKPELDIELDSAYKAIRDGKRLKQAGSVFAADFKTTINPLENFKNWGNVSTVQKFGKGLGIIGDGWKVIDNFSNTMMEDGKLSLSADHVQDFVTDTAVDFASTAGAMGAGAAIGTAFLPPVGTVVGAAAGVVIDAAINLDVVDWDGDGTKDSVVDGLKMGVDNLCDTVGGWLSKGFW